MATKKNITSVAPDNKGAEKKEKQFALGKQNFLLIAAAFLLVIVGFALMLGSGSTEAAYNPDIFSVRRIVIAPTIAFLGFVFMIYAIMHKSK